MLPSPPQGLPALLQAAATNTTLASLSAARDAAHAALNGTETGATILLAESAEAARLLGIHASLETACNLFANGQPEDSMLGEVQTMLRLAVEQLSAKACICRDNDGFSARLRQARK